MRSESLSFAFALPCFNEAQNLPALLPLLDRTRFQGNGPVRFVVVSDAAYDGTDDVVENFARATPTPVQLIKNPERSGKPAAINRCIRELRGVDVIVLVAGDVMPSDSCIELLLQAFTDPTVGVAAGRPVPVGPRENAACEVTRVLWAMHHLIASRFPKSTEVTAFRNVIDGIDGSSLVDEAELDIRMQQEGLRLRYVPDALIYRPSPLSLRDYLKQRTTVTLGYVRLKKARHQVIATSRLRERLRAMAMVWRTGEFRSRTLLLAVVLEIIVRGWAWVRFVRGLGKNGIVERSESTKRPVTAADVARI